MLHNKNTRKDFVVLATRLEKSALAQLKAMARAEQCPVSVIVRKAIDVLGETYQRELVPTFLSRRLPTLKDPIGITVRIDRLQGQRVKNLSRDRKQSVSDLLRICIHYFTLLYQGSEYRSSKTEVIEIPSEQVRVSTEVDKETADELTEIGLQQGRPLPVVISDALNLYTTFYNTKALTQGISVIKAFMNHLSVILPSPQEAPGKTIEQVLQEYFSGTQNKIEDSRKVSATREENEDKNGEKSPEPS